MARKNGIYLIILSLLLLSSCSTENRVDPYQHWSAAAIYVRADENLQDNNYENAIAGYKSLETQYPFGDYTEQAQLALIYANFSAGELPAALTAADRFIRLHPRHPHVDYAYYMRGIIKSMESISNSARILPLDLTLRDPSNWQAAYTYFMDMLARFPNSRYAPDARQRLIALRNDLAQYEINVAEYYMTRKAYLAAAVRAHVVLRDFPETPQHIDALIIMVQAYEGLGLPELANKSYEVLLLNNPESAEHLNLDPEDDEESMSIFPVSLWPFS